MKLKKQIFLFSLVLFILWSGYFLFRLSQSTVWGNVQSIKNGEDSYALTDIQKMYSSALTGSQIIDSQEWKFIARVNNTFSGDLNIVNSTSWYSINKLNTILKDYKNVVSYDVELNIYDFLDKSLVKNGQVYINWFYLWEFQDGKFVWTFKWLKNIELFNVVIKSKDYWDGFVTLNAINSRGTLLFSDVYLKKAEKKKIILPTTQTIVLKNFRMKFPDCALISRLWECYRWSVEVKSNYIFWEDVNLNKLSLNMSALSQWEIVTLKSWWMAFVEFITENWEILKLKENTTYELVYDVLQSDIDNMSETGNTNWFWYYDKIKWIWLQSKVTWVVNKEAKTITFQANKLY